MKTIIIVLQISFAFHYSFGQNIKNCVNDYQNNHGNPQILRECVMSVQAPHFKVASTKGQVFDTTTLKERVVLLNFWFINCQPCIKEIPNLNSLYKKFKGEAFDIISFSPDSKDEIEKFIKRYPIHYPIISNAKQLIEEDFQIKAIGYPTSILVNKEGRIIEFRSGIPSDEAGISKAVSELETMITSELNK